MVAGFDRYYQIARCFRDEDLRADRQPEFTQLDMEFAFVEETRRAGFRSRTMIRAHLQGESPASNSIRQFPRITYAEAMRRYGSDKPDLRIALELVDVADTGASHVEFKVFSRSPANNPDHRVAALRVPRRRRHDAQADRRATVSLRRANTAQRVSHGFASTIKRQGS